ncbi:MAG: LacI family DNA-binding transcriptional regulator [Clostridiales bacterium]|nr:LacI family DNA-binding transcriptional regulator [Clostridiales bacterium]
MAEVSTATVSRILNNDETLITTPETKKNVLAAAKKLYTAVVFILKRSRR